MSGDRGQQRWGLVFSMASTIAPVLLGMIVGALVSGSIRVAGRHRARAASSRPGWRRSRSRSACSRWRCARCSPRPTSPSRRRDPALREDFRRRALAAAVAVGVAALVAFVLAGDGAPRVASALAARRWSWPFHALTGAAALTAIAALATRRFRLARAAVAAQTVLILLGWALAQYPYLVVPDVTLHERRRQPAHAAPAADRARRRACPCWSPASCCCSACSSATREAESGSGRQGP